MTILIADDNELNLYQLQILLSCNHYQVVLATNGAEALSKARQSPPDLLITDILMPVMDGFSLCREWKKDEKLKNIPLIFYTATYIDERDRDFALSLGAVRFVVKPEEPDTFLKIIREAVNQTHATPPPPQIPTRLAVEAPQEEEAVFLKQYNQALIRKLEAKMQQLEKTNAELEERVRQRTAELEAAFAELETFSYSVSHDLRAPLRAIDNFTKILNTSHKAGLDEEGSRILGIICSETQRMGRLIDDLLEFSRMNRLAMQSSPVDMTALARSVFDECAARVPDRSIEFKLQQLPPAKGDPAMLRQAMINLVSNAIKFTRPMNPARIEIGSRVEGRETVYFIQDNGVGFDMKYAGKLFNVFQRLHPESEFEGTGVGLALVQRILRRHGGRVWADAAPNQGACFYFTLQS